MGVNLKYCYSVFDTTYVVYFEAHHRFIQFKEPAFFVFKLWNQGSGPESLAQICAKRYGLPLKDASRFSLEIVAEIENFTTSTQNHSDIQPVGPFERSILSQPKKSQDSFSTGATAYSRQYFLIGNRRITLSFGNDLLEETFRPLFSQFEVRYESLKLSGTPCSVNNPPSSERNHPTSTDNYHFFLYQQDQSWCIERYGTTIKCFPEEDWEHFHGAVYVQLLELLHGRKLQEWMGVFHASAVVKEDKNGVTCDNGALIFLGKSGSGKSTVAAILMAYGYRVLSDDFLPVSKHQDPNAQTKNQTHSEDSTDLQVDIPLVYPLPTAISVKKEALSVLNPFFPELMVEFHQDGQEIDKNDYFDKNRGEGEDNEEVWESVTFLPLSGNAENLSPVPAQAIFFIKYDPAVEFSLTRESNLEMMNDFLKQSWIANNTVAAQAFLDWYFSLPVYTLVYSDAEQMVEGLKNLV